VNKIKKEIQKVIVGQEELIDSLIIALLCGGNILLEGMPGLAKTMSVKVFAKSLGIKSKRVQFTPDLLPSDIIGAEIFSPKDGEFKIKKGPIFTNILLADEINRASAKVQSALLEAMQEKQVTIANKSLTLDEPFLVLATQNPIEQEGTYPLPEAQLDRFMFKVEVSYNKKEEELEILNRAERGFDVEIKKVVTSDEILKAKKEVENIFIDEPLKRYIIDIINATREHQKTLYGSSIRGAIDLMKASKAKAYMQNRDYVTPKDILENIKRTLRHRVILDYSSKAEGIKSDEILEEISKNIPIP
jgi:MoxR-like ATPase